MAHMHARVLNPLLSIVYLINTSELTFIPTSLANNYLLAQQNRSLMQSVPDPPSREGAGTQTSGAGD